MVTFEANCKVNSSDSLRVEIVSSGDLANSELCIYGDTDGVMPSPEDAYALGSILMQWAISQIGGEPEITSTLNCAPKPPSRNAKT
jgi:hypothetical protein